MMILGRSKSCRWVNRQPIQSGDLIDTTFALECAQSRVNLAIPDVLARSPSQDAARRPMGLNKREHIWQMMQDPEVEPVWKDAHGGKAPN